MDPASIAAATGLAGLVREYGVTGLLALSLLANVWLVKKWKECTDARIADPGCFAALVEKASQTMAAVAVAPESRTGIFERLSSQIESGHRDAELAAVAIKGPSTSCAVTSTTCAGRSEHDGMLPSQGSRDDPARSLPWRG